DVDAAHGPGAAEHDHQDHQRAGTAGAVDAADTRIVDHATKRELHDCRGEFLVPDHALVGLGARLVVDALLGFTDCRHDRRVVLVVFVYPYTQIDLVGSRIGGVFGHQHENLVERGLLQGFEHLLGPVGRRRPGGGI